jgi:hypothetical protein
MAQANAHIGYDGSPNTGCGAFLSEATFEAGLCCYEVQQCGTGRPYLDGGRARTALPHTLAPDSAAWTAEGAASDVTALAPALRARLAAVWTADALLEHASIASFGRFALELMAVGAPSDLVADAHRAALDEVEHARLCFGLAQAYAGEAVTPSPFPFEGRVEVSADLASIAARAAREGCIGETLASIQAAEQLAHAEEPSVRAALEVIAEDEARHAELAWRFVAWALARGWDGVRAAVGAAFRAPVALAAPGEALPREMIAHGRLDPCVLRDVARRALEEVVQPCAARVLAAAAIRQRAA